MQRPTININDMKSNQLINFEPSDDDLKKIEDEIDKLLNPDD
tara:strand:- start:346 stop:471 length:126 start_codon:yes stop_codon:yes gene_type:complete